MYFGNWFLLVVCPVFKIFVYFNDCIYICLVLCKLMVTGLFFFKSLSCNALLNRLILEGAQYKWNKLLLLFYYLQILISVCLDLHNSDYVPTKCIGLVFCLEYEESWIIYTTACLCFVFILLVLWHDGKVLQNGIPLGKNLCTPRAPPPTLSPSYATT